MHIEPEIQDTTIVLVGRFNPAIINPDWLLRYELIGRRAASESGIDIIHPSLAQFRVADLEFNIDPQRFQILSRSGPWIRIADTVSNIFGTHLPHTPVTAFGINRTVHFRVNGEPQRNAIGRMLAPLGPWGEWGETIEKGAGETRGGMISLSVQEVEIIENRRRKITASVQPSVVISYAAGIYVTVNDHYEFPDKVPDTPTVIKLLYDNFEPSIQKSEGIIDIIMKLRDNKYA